MIAKLKSSQEIVSKNSHIFQKDGNYDTFNGILDDLLSKTQLFQKDYPLNAANWYAFTYGGTQGVDFEEGFVSSSTSYYTGDNFANLFSSTSYYEHENFSHYNNINLNTASAGIGGFIGAGLAAGLIVSLGLSKIKEFYHNNRIKAVTTRK